MATPIPPDIRVRIYQLEVNGGGTDIQKKASPVPLQYVTASSSNDFHLIDLGELSESIEVDRAVYEMESIHVTVDGISATYFGSYVDPVTEPFVGEIYDTSTSEVVFHGPIERTSIRYNPRTGYTDFDILSWTHVLEQTAAAARSVYETKLSKDYKKSSSSTGITLLTIPRTADDGEDMNGQIVQGDVAVLETPYGEWRSTITGIVATTATEITIAIVGEPENVALSNYTVTSGNCSRTIYQIALNQKAEVLKLIVSNATLWGALNDLRDDIQSDPSIRTNAFIDAAITYPTSGDQQPVRMYPNGTMNYTYSVAGQVGMNPRAWALSDDETTVTLTFDTDAAYVTDALANGVTINTIVVPTDARKGTRVRILGKLVYGYAPSAGLTPALDNYLKTEVLEGLFGITALGAFRFVTDTFTYPTGFNSEEYPRYLEWPDNAIESLRLMQNTERAFLKFTPTLDGSSLPRLTVEVIRRDNAETGTRSTTALTGIIDYQESSADLTPRGLNVEPSVLYNIPNGLKRYTTRGFYYDGIASDDPKTTVPPNGSDVPTIKINMQPDWENGDVWVSNDKGIWNPANYETAARFFWAFWSDLNGPASMLVDGAVSRSVLGNFVSINQGGVTRTMFVTGRVYNAIEKVTELKGLRGEFATSITGNPVAVVDGGLLYFDVDAGGDEDIKLSGMRSYSPLQLPITYEWILDPTGTPSTIGTQAALDYTLSVGTHTIRLTVDDGTNTDSADVTVVVANNTGDTTGYSTSEADFTAGPTLAIDAAGDVTVSVGADSTLTQTTNGIKIYYSLTAVSGPWTLAATVSNPVTEQAVYSALAEDTTIWVRVVLVNATDGSDSSNEWIGSISNTLGSDVDNLTVNTLLELFGSFDMVGGASDTFSVDINSVVTAEIDAAGFHYTQESGDSFDLYHVDRFAMILDDVGFEWHVATGDIYVWKINNSIYAQLDETSFSLGVDLDMGSNSLSNVADVNGVDVAAGSGVNFGPGAVTSITVAHGIITAIS